MVLVRSYQDCFESAEKLNRPVRADHASLSPDSGTNGRSPEVSSSAFDAQPLDLQPVPLMDTDFAVNCPLVRHRMPQIRFCTSARAFAPRFLQTPPRGDALALRYHFTSITL